MLKCALHLREGWLRVQSKKPNSDCIPLSSLFHLCLPEAAAGLRRRRGWAVGGFTANSVAIKYSFSSEDNSPKFITIQFEVLFLSPSPLSKWDLISRGNVCEGGQSACIPCYCAVTLVDSLSQLSPCIVQQQAVMWGDYRGHLSKHLHPAEIKHFIISKGNYMSV